MTGDQTPLERVYTAGSPSELGRAYADWAAGYDRETAALGYLLPFFITSFVARHVSRGDGPILDAGCGTGLSGRSMAALGYDRLEGLDFSREMLDVAAGRGTYAALTRATLGETLPFADGYFAAVFSTGVFTEGHAPPSAFREIVRITRPGGHVIATVRDSLLEPGGFDRVFAELAALGLWTLVEASPGFRAFAVAEPDVIVKAFVFRIA